MAGHSKFKNIMYRKGAQDKKRSALFSKLSREITVAAKKGIPDPDANARLCAAMIASGGQSSPQDNRHGPATNMRRPFSKSGGNVGASGSVSHGFERMGLVEYPASAGDADKVLEAAIEAGAEDVESDEDGHRIWTSVETLHEVARALEPMLGEGEGAKLAWRPSTEVEVRGEDAQLLLKLLDALEEDDDVQTVWGNEKAPEEELERLS